MLMGFVRSRIVLVSECKYIADTSVVAIKSSDAYKFNPLRLYLVWIKYFS